MRMTITKREYHEIWLAVRRVMSDRYAIDLDATGYMDDWIQEDFLSAFGVVLMFVSMGGIEKSRGTARLEL